jgi:hypothetical protein
LQGTFHWKDFGNRRWQIGKGQRNLSAPPVPHVSRRQVRRLQRTIGTIAAARQTAPPAGKMNRRRVEACRAGRQTGSSPGASGHAPLHLERPSADDRPVMFDALRAPDDTHMLAIYESPWLRRSPAGRAESAPPIPFPYARVSRYSARIGLRVYRCGSANSIAGLARHCRNFDRRALMSAGSAQPI